MQDVIREEFTERGHTVIAISHRVGVVSGGSEDVVAWVREGSIERIERAENSDGESRQGDLRLRRIKLPRDLPRI